METDLNVAINLILDGACILSIEGFSTVIVFEEMKLDHSRSPDEPKNEKVIRGSHDGFVESLNTNLSIIRNRIKTGN
ncbi:spore germination protein [Alkalihalobacterium elongatum]|uniref:spore germination protein n=1 Tax=Alkalihalobacterium elongatum TaxID=2675466 RepID=UPI001C1F313F|nr:spore germination protein [Alkalihalobacterium elongatum]